MQSDFLSTLVFFCCQKSNFSLLDLHIGQTQKNTLIYNEMNQNNSISIAFQTDDDEEIKTKLKIFVGNTNQHRRLGLYAIRNTE